MSRQPLSTTTLLTAALASAAAVAVASVAYVHYSQTLTKTKRSRLENHANNVISHPPAAATHFDEDDSVNAPILPREFDEDLIQEFLARNYAFFGPQGMHMLRSASVVVVGCGGVGSWAALMLLRSGVSRIRLIDFDLVSLSSLNRHAVATLADVGTPKVTAVKAFFAKIAPWAHIDARIELWNDSPHGHQLLEGADWVIDAIDNITTKVDLLAHCHRNGIKVFASMGAGAKCDPTRVQISDIALTQEDPLARSVRRRLRAKGVHEGIPVVYSTEVPGPVKLLPLPEEEFQKGAVHELGALDDFRVRILPVLGGLPSIFGVQAATYVVCELAGKPIPHPLPAKNRFKTYDKLLRDLYVRESKLNEDKLPKKLPIDESDVAYIYEDLHRGGRSIVPPHAVLAKPQLSRWDVSRPLSVDNCVLLSPRDLDRLDAAGGVGPAVERWGGSGKDGEDAQGVSGEMVHEMVRKRQDEARGRVEMMWT
ncbi:hypothetical protein DL93DRAFT_2127421 [Clavulina sp. PMI_390]|nr:hypothetical protein DL93DRAFT_2127421 [Clavulina sp. PMI_390]